MDNNIDTVTQAAAKDIAALQKEVSRLQKLIAAQGTDAYYELRDRAGKVYENAAPKAKTAIAQIRAEGSAAADAAREHPAATTTALACIGALGFLAGYLLGATPRQEPRQWWQK